jgi:hypothetical protein
MRTYLLLGLLLVTLVGCADLFESESSAPYGLARTDSSKPGPQVVFNPLRLPQPEIPFPNDLALRRRSDGGTFVNVSNQSETRVDRLDREHLDEIDGFSGLSPIQISFDGPIDLTTVTDNTVYVVNIQPGSPRFGERLPLDLGRGWFPHEAVAHAYFPRDELKDFTSFILPPDNKVDTDGNGTPDKWVYHYEVATHTLDIRPLMPLQSGAQYAVVVTTGIKGWDSKGNYGPIRSPFEIVNHDVQTKDLERALPSLQEAGVERKDIGFAWTMTTGDLSRTFRALRDGLYGKGSFAWLNKEFPAGIRALDDMGISFDGDNSYGPMGGAPFPTVAWDSTFVLQGAYMKKIVGIIGAILPAGGFDHVSHLVFGDFDTVNLRATPDNVWKLDVQTGTIQANKAQFHEKVPFMLIVPKTTEQHKPPFPVVVYAHATGTSRIECLLMADRLAQAGIAVFSIDAVGHGPVLTDPLKMLANMGSSYLPLIRKLLPQMVYPDYLTRFPESMSNVDVFKELMKNGFIEQLAVKGRATDDNGDCNKEGGEAYYAPNAFRLRDAMRQTTLDYIVAVRMLRSLTQAKVPAPPGLSEDVSPTAPLVNPHTTTPDKLMPSYLAGDFDLDGKVDAGGPDVPYFMMGVSLGGIHTALTAPLEPYIVAAAPVVPGAGLADIFMRTKLHDRVTALFLSLGGPKVIGCPVLGSDGKPTGKVRLSWNNDSDDCSAQTRQVFRDPKTQACMDTPVDVPTWFKEVTMPAGAEVVLKNLANGNTIQQTVSNDGGFAVAVPTDEGDPIQLTLRTPGSPPFATVDAVAPKEGLAKQRNTPDFRKFVQLAANVLEGADAITAADKVLLDPPKGSNGTNMLMMLAVNDHTVPFTTGVTLARATGLFGRDKLRSADAPYRSWFEQAIASGLLAGKDVPPPLISPNAEKPLQKLCNLIPTGPGQPDGVSGVCLADVHGHHEYIAQSDKSDSFPPVPGTTMKSGVATPYLGTFTEFHRNLIVTYFHSLGTQVLDDVCWGDAACVVDQKLTTLWDGPVAAVKKP